MFTIHLLDISYKVIFKHYWVANSKVDIGIQNICHPTYESSSKVLVDKTLYFTMTVYLFLLGATELPPTSQNQKKKSAHTLFAQYDVEPGVDLSVQVHQTNKPQLFLVVACCYIYNM